MSFNNDLKRGKHGEYLLAAALEKKGHTVQIVSSDVYYQYHDIDLLLTNKSGQHTTVEVKNDFRSEDTGNVFVEFQNNNNKSRNYKGWYYYCDAAYIAFVQENFKLAHLISSTHLKEMCETGKYKINNSIDTRGWCVPLDVIQSAASYKCIYL